MLGVDAADNVLFGTLVRSRLKPYHTPPCLLGTCMMSA